MQCVLTDDSADNSFTLTASLPVAVKEAEQGLIYSSSFLMSVDTDEESGYYELFFHNCHNHGRLSKKKNDPTILITMEVSLAHNLQNNVVRISLNGGQIWTSRFDAYY